LNKYGIVIKKLVLRGSGKKDAILTFNKGLNVIAGASDTGKSFAYECINYAFGASDIPSIPNESIGYDSVLLEFIERKAGQTITLKRNLNETDNKDVFYIYSDIAHINDADFEVLSISANAKNSLSKQLLNLCNCSYENILTSTAKGKTEAFTFRKFVYLTMLNETRIFQRNSSIFLTDVKRNQNTTKEMTSFFTILSGMDYQKHIKLESVEVAKARLKGRLEELSLICNELRLEIVELEKETQEPGINDIDKKIAEIEDVIETHKRFVKHQEEAHSTLTEETRVAVSEKIRISENLSKFRLLKKNYESDIERLDFIEQSNNFTSQLLDVRCPVCDAPMTKEENRKNGHVYFVAIDKEKQKLNSLLSDLEGTIVDFHSDLSECIDLIGKKQSEIEVIEKKLQEQSISISKTLSDYENYLKIRDKVIEIKNNKKKLINMNSRISELSDKIDNAKSDDNKVEIKKLSDELIQEFCDIIEVFLKDWGFLTKGDVLFDKKNSDIIVAGKTKASYGKGARAIINSAVILSIMKYCLDREIPHPAFVILDSPLTTYKERDKKISEKKEDINKGIKESFFRDLAKVKEDWQIIIFDNELPPSDLENITYHHFTGNLEINRAGFIPKTAES